MTDYVKNVFGGEGQPGEATVGRTSEVSVAIFAERIERVFYLCRRQGHLIRSVSGGLGYLGRHQAEPGFPLATILARPPPSRGVEFR